MIGSEAVQQKYGLTTAKILSAAEVGIEPPIMGTGSIEAIKSCRTCRLKPR